MDDASKIKTRERAISQPQTRQRAGSWASRKMRAEVSSAPVVMEGWVKKQSVSANRFKNWKRRYLMLRKDCSVTWHSDADGPQLGKLVLVAGTKVTELEDTTFRAPEQPQPQTPRTPRTPRESPSDCYRLLITSNGVELLIETDTTDEKEQWYLSVSQLLRIEQSVKFRSNNSLEEVFVFFDEDAAEDAPEDVEAREDAGPGEVSGVSEVAQQVLQVSIAGGPTAPPPPPGAAGGAKAPAGTCRPCRPSGACRPAGALPPLPCSVGSCASQPTLHTLPEDPSPASGEPNSTELLERAVHELALRVGISVPDAAVALCAANGSSELAMRALEASGGPLRRRFRLACSSERASGVFCLDGTCNGAARYRAVHRHDTWILRLPSGEWSLVGHPSGQGGPLASLDQAKAGRTVSGITEIPALGWTNDSAGCGPYSFAWISDVSDGDDPHAGDEGRPRDTWA